MSKPIVEIKNISKKYQLGESFGYGNFREEFVNSFKGLFSRESKDDKNTLWALDDVSFDVHEGDVIGIIGRNGAGKSTLLKILSRITEPTSGEIILRGRVASLLEVGTGFHPELTGRENVFFNGALLGMTKPEIKSKFDEIVAFSELDKFIDTPVKRYSSGMYVRLAFAVAAHLEPEILVIDEVLAVGDAEFQKKCLGKMSDVASSGRTIFFVSHNLGAVSTLCNKGVLLTAGTVKAIGTSHEVISAYSNLNIEESSRTVTRNMRVKGSGEVQIKKCTIMDLNNIEKNRFLIDEDIKISFDVESEYEGTASFWVIIFDSEKRPFLCSHQRDLTTIKIEKGKYVAEISTIGLGLLPGVYSVAAGIFDKSRDFFDWIDDCQSFEVEESFLNGNAYDNRWGLYNQKADWTVTKV